MKVHLNGATHWASQVPRIADGFRQLGHEVTPHVSDADCVYSNNDHAQVVADKAAGRLKPGAKVILAQLDIPLHVPTFDFAACKRELLAADAVCSISAYGHWQLAHYLDIQSTVIFQPIKPVARSPDLARKPFYRFLHCGRRADSNKRFALGVGALQLLEYTHHDLCLVGNEIGWGDYIGVLNDENLNIVYNSVDFVLCTSACEGLCLPVLEAMSCGVVPVVCRDMTTREELLPPGLFPEYEAIEPTPASIARFIAHFVNDDSGVRLAEMKARLQAHFLANWQEKTSGLGVARRILETYERIA